MWERSLNKKWVIWFLLTQGCGGGYLEIESLQVACHLSQPSTLYPASRQKSEMLSSEMCRHLNIFGKQERQIIDIYCRLIDLFFPPKANLVKTVTSVNNVRLQNNYRFTHNCINTWVERYMMWAARYATTCSCNRQAWQRKQVEPYYWLKHASEKQ